MYSLDNYKKAWGNQPEETYQFSALEIYKLAHSKSSSIVKWIFIIGILEFVVLNSLSFFIDTETSYDVYKEMGLEKTILYSTIVAYGVLFYFLVLFYLNYKRISTTDSSRQLMKKIIKTRKTVRNYVLFNFSYMAFVIVLVTAAYLKTHFNDLEAKQIVLILLLIFVLTLIILGVLWLFYQLLYGILLRKLNYNYKALAKLEKES
ncbi:hypothetical protein PI23P_12152 [Polaribacter irgensii 23-P]|uniref:Uncharacterized protein n=1 Tax=Polaribacter irgensii 23-P TaxID=313594 RepID=A4C1T3_9FLAO|nr:hypothetical protein [Polaribacter irgensii]EAR12086.1 hypothetical protein PI23P_12152 [Polaribacter irgensii 23-P]